MLNEEQLRLLRDAYSGRDDVAAVYVSEIPVTYSVHVVTKVINSSDRGSLDNLFTVEYHMLRKLLGCRIEMNYEIFGFKPDNDDVLILDNELKGERE